jgi:predicted NBD/HSP70 family sugar kinase
MAVAIGVDIGGSAIKFAAVDQSGIVVWPNTGIVDRVSYNVETPGIARLMWHSTGDVEEVAYEPAPTDSPVDGKWVVPAAIAQTALRKALRRIDAGFSDPIAAVGIGATGLIGPNGIVNEGYAFSGYRGLDWAAVAAQAGYGRGVRVLNDARAGAWAEYVRTGMPNGTFLHVTAGTRVGCAIIENGRFLEGADSCAGEFSYQQWIEPGNDRYRADARLMDGLIDDPMAFGAALTGVMHVINPNRIVLRGFAPDFVCAVQAHLKRYVFKTHLRTILLEVGQVGEEWDETAYAAVARYQENPGSLVYVTRHGYELSSALLIDGCIRNSCVDADFLGRMIICAPQATGRPGDICFGETAGSFGIEAAYAARTGRRAGFVEIAAAAIAENRDATACLERAAMVTAAGIVNVYHMVGAQLITVGGAVPLLYPAYLQIANAYVTAHLDDYGLIPTLKPGAAGNDAGVIGAALYALRLT